MCYNRLKIGEERIKEGMNQEGRFLCPGRTKKGNHHGLTRPGAGNSIRRYPGKNLASQHMQPCACQIREIASRSQASNGPLPWEKVQQSMPSESQLMVCKAEHPAHAISSDQGPTQNTAPGGSEAHSHCSQYERLHGQTSPKAHLGQIQSTPS